MRIATALPPHLLDEADAAAKHRGISRSRLMLTALEKFLQRRRDAQTPAGVAAVSLVSNTDRTDCSTAWAASPML
jgi:metal-responsive CopG/Arc/MetJ family transcriptional regulator